MKENCSPKFAFPQQLPQHTIPKKRIFIDPSSTVSVQPSTRRALASRNLPHEWNQQFSKENEIQNHSLPLPLQKELGRLEQQQQQQLQYNQQRRIFQGGASHQRNPSDSNHLRATRGNSLGKQSAATLFKAIFAANSTKNYLAQQSSFQNPGDVQCSYEDDDSIYHEGNSNHHNQLAAFKKLSHLKLPPKPETAARFVSTIHVFSNLTKFIGFNDLLNLQYVCKTFASYSYQRHVRRHLHSFIQKGITNCQLYALWDNSIHFNSVQSRHELQFYNFTLIPSDFDAEIIQDSNRTLLSRAEPFEGKKKEKLKKVLRSICHNVKDVGYVRGMNEIVGGLLAGDVFKQNETYWIVLFMLRKLKLKDLFTQGFPRLNILCFQLQIFMQNYSSDLLNFLQRFDVPVLSFAAKWFLTLFASEFPQNLLMQVWSLILIKGQKALIQVSIGLLQLFQNEIMSCTSTEAIVTLLKNLTPAQSISEKRASETLIEISKSIKITNRMLSSLEKIYELHPSYLRESLTIMLFQNRHLNNAYDWKILPQAPDFSGPNATLERLNAHTMVADYFNELTAIESQRQKPASLQQQPIGQKSHALAHHSRSLSLNRGVLGAGKIPSLNSFASDSKLQEQQIPQSTQINPTNSNNTSNDVGIFKQISKKLISIFSDEQPETLPDLNQNRSPINNEFPNTINTIPAPTINVQTSLQYFDQILGEMKEVLQERNVSFDDESSPTTKYQHQHQQQHPRHPHHHVPDAKRLHSNHQAESNQIKQCLRRDESFSDLNDLENLSSPFNQFKHVQQPVIGYSKASSFENSHRRFDSGFDDNFKSLRVTTTTMVSSSAEGITNCSSKHSQMHMMKTLPLHSQYSQQHMPMALKQNHTNHPTNSTLFSNNGFNSASSRMLPPKVPVLNRAETTPLSTRITPPTSSNLSSSPHYNDVSIQRQSFGSQLPIPQNQQVGWTLIRK